MKKVISIVLVLAMLLSLCGCSGGGKPKGFSDGAYNTAKNAIESIDQFLDGELDEDDFYGELERYRTLMQSYMESKDYEEDEDKYGTSTSYFLILTEIEVVMYQLLKEEMDTVEIRDARNMIAECIGESIRK